MNHKLCINDLIHKWNVFAIFYMPYCISLRSMTALRDSHFALLDLEPRTISLPPPSLLLLLLLPQTLLAPYPNLPEVRRRHPICARKTGPEVREASSYPPLPPPPSPPPTPQLLVRPGPTLHSGTLCPRNLSVRLIVYRLST